MPIIMGSNIYEAWKSILRKILDDGEFAQDENKNMTREILNLFTTVENPLDLKDFDKFQLTRKQIYEFAKSLLNEEQANLSGFIPGIRLHNFLGYDQWERVCNKLKKNPETRRAAIMLCEPSRDWQDKRPPSLLMIDFKLRRGKLHLTAVIRSNDMFRLWPANAYSLAKLLEKTCKKLDGVEPGTLNILSISAHIYEDDVEKIRSLDFFR